MIEPSLDAAKAFCAAVIKSAVKDFVNERARSDSFKSAARFLFAPQSNFVWMAWGLGLDLGSVRAAIRRQRFSP